MNQKIISGFSKLTKEEKISVVASEFFPNPTRVSQILRSFWHDDPREQKAFDEFSENTLTNFYLPFGVAPNFLIDGQLYCIPMVIEESSVVAAAAKSAKYWLNKGGFHTEVISTTKIGQVHFLYNGDPSHLESFFQQLKPTLLKEVAAITANMEKRGGGIREISLVAKTTEMENYYQLFVEFETCDAMGANFINSILEKFADVLVESAKSSALLSLSERNIKIIMSILSNYTPQCLVKAWVEAPLESMGPGFTGGVHTSDDVSNQKADSQEFVEKFAMAVQIAKIDPYRATTHNKGIFNGIDAVVQATGNDYRAVEACGHTYACRYGRYQGLTDISLEGGVFRFSLEIPLGLGTVGGLTTLHPLGRMSLELLGNPRAEDLMRIVASVGLAQNFAAISSLVTTGIQKGHMKMHLLNILNQLQANESERLSAKEHFASEVISFGAVRNFLQSIRKFQ